MVKRSFGLLITGTSLALVLAACSVSNTSTIVSSGNTLQVRSSTQQSINAEPFVLPVTQKETVFVLEEKVTMPVNEKSVIQDKALEKIELTTQAQAEAAETHSCGR